MTKSEAIDILNKLKEYPTVLGNLIDEHGKIKGALDLAIQALESQKWIPVSERLPEEGGEYIITIANYEPHTEISWFYENEKVWSHKNADVSAWMPLPQPYKEGDEE